MRRWLPWTIVAAVLLALAVALTRIPPAPPHEFLRNRIPMTKGEDETLVYCFKDDYLALRQAAAKELRSQGFEQFPPDGASELDTLVLFSRGPGATTEQAVMIFRDYKASASIARSLAHSRALPIGVAEQEDLGWVTILVIGAHEPTWFEGLCSWLSS